MFQIHVRTTINGDDTEFSCEADETLLDVLRDRLGLTGTKEGCGTGDCGPAQSSSMAAWCALA
jgi:carbon-monoxide dehydrogenase small subunit